MISECKCDDIPPKMQILNMLIPILMHICSFVSNWSVASHQSLHVIKKKCDIINDNDVKLFPPQYILLQILDDNPLQDQVH